MLEPLIKTRLYEEIVKQFIAMIRNGTLKPGDKLPTERDLALQLKVSRTAIREALRSLEMLGVVDTKVGSGTYIKEVTFNKLLDSVAGVLAVNDRLILELLEVRMLLEVEIARLAARKTDASKMESLKRALDEMEEEISSGEIGLIGDNTFHNELAIAADNLAMTSILGLCGELLSSTRKAALEAIGDPRIGLEHHRKLFNAICRGDEEASAMLMKEHLDIAYRNIADGKTAVGMNAAGRNTTSGNAVAGKI